MSTPICVALTLYGFLQGEPLRDKTMVAWVSPAQLDQRGGSVLTLDDRRARFDAIVFGEIEPRRWMAGSELFARTQRDQAANTEERALPGEWIQVALVTKGNRVSLYRNGEVYAQYELDPERSALEFSDDAVVVAGMRHLDQADGARFLGAVDDLRIYDRAFTAEEIRALRANEPSAIRPWAWWSFEGNLSDAVGRFGAATLQGVAEVRDGQLRLLGGAFLAARTREDLESALPLVPDPAINEDIERARALRHRLLADRDRPTYHFVIPEGFAMPFDPNGAIYWKGRYHLFYIYQERGIHYFGHVSSLDMVHWRHHPPALFPTPDSPEKGIFSGNCFVNKKGEATMVYHGVDAGNCIATSTDELLEHWTKLPTNPFVPPGPEGAAYRAWDPFGWLDGNTYYAIAGGERAAVFKADELTDKWAYVGDFLHHTVPGVELREDISCADFFQLGGRDVLVCISHRLGTRYYVGDWKDEQFHPELHEQMSWVDNLYFAPESLLTPDGRRVMWAWVFDQRNARVRQGSGWSGEMSLPREISLGPDNRLRMRPVRELERLRYDERVFGPIELVDEQEIVVDGLLGDTLELLVEIEPANAREVGVRVRRSPDGSEGMTAAIDRDRNRLVLGNEAGPLEVHEESVNLRIYVDRSIVEAFADDRQAAVRRIYPRGKESLGVSVFAKGGPARIRRITAWKMFPANAH